MGVEDQTQMDRFVQQISDTTLKYTRKIRLTNLAMNILSCIDMGFDCKTEIYIGQENDPKLWKTEEPDMTAIGTFVT